MSNIYIGVWVVIAVLSLLIEAVTTAMVSIWFCAGAAAALAACLLGANGLLQACVFVGVSVLMLLLFLRYENRWAKDKQTDDAGKFNTDRLIGRVVYIDETVDNIKGTGGCKLDGQYWTCRTEDNADLPAGEKAVVVAIRGSRHIVKEIS